MEDVVVRLRGHHLLCLLGFRGLGYSEEFIENMARLQARVFSANCIVEIVTGADDICGACPRLEEDGRCSSAQFSKVDSKDATVLSLLSLRPGDRLDAGDIYRKIAEKITPKDLSRICSKCQWLSLGYCADGLSQL